MAAVASRSTRNSPHLSARMSSPKDSKRHSTIKTEDSHRKESPLHQSQEVRQASPRREAPPSDTKVEERPTESDTSKTNTTATTNAQPLAPPPRPAPQNPTDTPDYFSQSHNSSHFQLEPNPFEQSFGNPAAETPGKQLLPPVASLTSPSSLLPGGTPGWSNSLRSGPLSPAMLAGPTGTDYFSESHFRGGFPTPNESSLRTGLTPGGGGSMFPAPSPNTQALFNSLQSGGATPNTLDFHRTALSAAAATKAPAFNMTSSGTTSQAPDSLVLAGVDNKQFQPLASTQPPTSQDPFGQHDTDAANGLYMLANANGSRNNSSFAVPGQPAHSVAATTAPVSNDVSQPLSDVSPTMSKRTSKKSIGSISGSAQGMSEAGDFSESGHSEQAKPATRSRGKKGSNAKQSANSRRKADETPVKTPANKRSKNNSGSAQQTEPSVEPEDSDEEQSPKLEHHESGKKMTDEEKRKNFLERNRVAALKCRQRKKQWLANLQAKVELFSTENDALSAQVTQLREEIVNLKTLLIAHKDCPVSQAQGLSGIAMQSFAGDVAHHANPYGLGMHPNGAQALGIPVPGAQQHQAMQRT